MTAREAAEAKADEARTILRARSLGAAVQARIVGRETGGYEIWEAGNATPLVLGVDAPGEWYLLAVWRYATVPAVDEPEAILVFSSISLNVRDVELTAHGFTQCFVRYDIERRNDRGVSR